MADGYRIEYREIGQDDQGPGIGGSHRSSHRARRADRGLRTDSLPILATGDHAVEGRLKKDQPTLGICLGAQIMARALGARVTQGGKGDRLDESLLRKLEESHPSIDLAGAKVLHWHGDTFEIPRGSAVGLHLCIHGSGLSWGQRGLAVQFVRRVRYQRWSDGILAMRASSPL